MKWNDHFIIIIRMKISYRLEGKIVEAFENVSLFKENSKNTIQTNNLSFHLGMSSHTISFVMHP